LAHTLLDRDKYFSHVFAHLSGQRVGIVLTSDNLGGQLHIQGMIQMLEYFGVSYYLVDTNPPAFKKHNQKTQAYAISGGGVMGRAYTYQPQISSKMPKVCPKKGWNKSFERRMQVLKTNRPVTVLPQSFKAKEPLNYHKVFVREHISQSFYPGAILAPDMSLGLEWKGSVPDPIHSLGIWLKSQDPEGIIQHPDNLGDPIAQFPKNHKKFKDYIRLAALYRHIVTDRTHFAVAAMMANLNSDTQRTITLMPCAYHKNLGIWESWLKDLGVYYEEGF